MGSVQRANPKGARGGVAALFDLRPKERRSELFDREREPSEPERALKRGSRWFLYPGFSRLGFRRIVAYSQDNLRNAKFLPMGLEVGLLHGLLEPDDCASPCTGGLETR